MMIPDIAVLSMRLPYVDRGALSQAWFDALHLGRNQRAAAVHRRAASTAVEHKQSPVRPLYRGCRSFGGSVSSTIRRHNDPSVQLVGECSTRFKAPLTRRTASRCIGRPSVKPPGFATTIVQLPEGERICLRVASINGGVRVTALCAFSMRSRVANALEDVRMMLALEGTPCWITTKGIAE